MNEVVSEFETLFIPLISNIYTSKRFPHILYDKQALSSKSKFPKDINVITKHVQYTYLSGSIRCKKIDDKVKAFLENNPEGIIVELGGRLSTSCFRCEVPFKKWYIVDSARNIKIREKLFEAKENVVHIKGDIFRKIGRNKILEDHPNDPILVIAVGIFNYYSKSDVESLLTSMYLIPHVDIVFDATNSIGLKRMKKFYKRVGINKEDNCFCVDKIEDLKINSNQSLIKEDRGYYEEIDKKGMNIFTRIFMKRSDYYNMISIYHIKNNF